MKKTSCYAWAACVAIVALAVSPAAIAAKKKTPTPSAAAAETKGGDAGATASGKSEKVNLNTADEKAIAGAKGVGPKLAAELVKGRPYKTWDEVSKVKGVGSGKKLDALKKVLKLSEGIGTAAAKEEPAAKKTKGKKAKISSKGEEGSAASSGAGAAAGGGGTAGSSGAAGNASAPSTPSSPSKKSSSSSSSSTSKLAPGTKININTASAGELEALPEIGPVKAQAIVDYRNANGRFVAPEDIMKVTGIKEGTFAKIKDYVVVR